MKKKRGTLKIIHYRRFTNTAAFAIIMISVICIGNYELILCFLVIFANFSIKLIEIFK